MKKIHYINNYLKKLDTSYNFLNSLRSRGVSAFKMSEYIGEKVLAYSPIPGQQIGCVDLAEATGGKAWSI